MDRFHLMNVYVAVAETEGFASAARRLHMSPPAVTRAVAALEQQLGVKLLNRTTRYVRTTEAGKRYLEDARRILAAVIAADEAASGINATPRGHLVVTAPVLFGRIFVMPAIVDYLQTYPQTSVEAIFLDRVVNMLEEGIDIGVRIGDLPDSSMRAIRVGEVGPVLCASKSYLQRCGVPESPEDLKQHSLITSRAGNSLSDWRFISSKGEQAISVQPRLSVSTNDAAIAATIADFGITRVLSYQAATHIASGELVPILENYAPASKPVHIVHREGHHASAKARAFIDLLADKLRAEPSLKYR